MLQFHMLLKVKPCLMQPRLFIIERLQVELRELQKKKEWRQENLVREISVSI